MHDLDVLGISKTATPQEIKMAYYGLAQKYHPDKNPSSDAKEKFAEVNKYKSMMICSAYETLSDESKRRVYDQSGLTGDEQA